MASVRRVLENRAENASAYGKVLSHSESEKHIPTTEVFSTLSHGASLANSALNELPPNTEAPLLFVRRREIRTPPIRKSASSPAALLHQRRPCSNEGKSLPHDGMLQKRPCSNEGKPPTIDVEERPLTASGVTGTTRSPISPDEGLASGNLTPLKISRRNNNMFRISPPAECAPGLLSNRMPKKHCNTGLSNVLASINFSKTPTTLVSINSESNVAAFPRKTDSTGLGNAMTTLTLSKPPPLANIKPGSNIPRASGSSAGSQRDKRASGSLAGGKRDKRAAGNSAGGQREKKNHFIRRSDSAGFTNALSARAFPKAVPLANIKSESNFVGTARSQPDNTAPIEADESPRKSDITPRTSESTPRKFDITPRIHDKSPRSENSFRKADTTLRISTSPPRKEENTPSPRTPRQANTTPEITPRKSDCAMNQPKMKFKLSLDISNILNRAPVAAAEAKSGCQDDGAARSSVAPLKFGLSRTGSTFTTDNGMVIGERGIAKEPPKSARAPKVQRKNKPKKMKAEFILLKELGRGAGGVVYKAVHVRTLNIVAIKKVRMATPSKKKQVMREVQALFRNLIPLSDKRKGSPCRNIVTFHGAFTNPETLHMSIVLEYMDWGVLRQLVKNGTRCTEGQLAYIGRSILNGLNFIHSCHQLHRDIKPDNVLVNSKGQIKISDFGITRDMNPQDSKDLAETFTGTVMYMSPERLAGKYYSYPSDIWSFGLSIATLALGKFPFDSKKGFWGIIGVLNNNPVPKLPDDEYSAEACDFVAQCLRKDSSKRMSTANLLRHSFLRQACGPDTFLKLFAPITESEKLANVRKIVGQLAQHYKKARKHRRRASSAPAASIQHQHLGRPDSCEDGPTDRCFANLAKQVGVSARKLKQYFEHRMNISKSTSKRKVRLPKIHMS